MPVIWILGFGNCIVGIVFGVTRIEDQKINCLSPEYFL